MFTILAQDVTPAEAYPEFATTAGIVMVVLFSVQILKYLLSGVPFAKRVPTWVYAVAIASAAVVFSIKVLGAMDAELGPAIYEAVKAAAIASGFHSWFAGVKDSPADKPPLTKPKTLPGQIPGAILLCLLLPAAGCVMTPDDAWHQQRAALNTANTVYLQQTADMSDAKIVFYGEILQAARAALEDSKTFLPEGGPGFKASLGIVKSVLVKWSQGAIDVDNSDSSSSNQDARDGPDADRLGRHTVPDAVSGRKPDSRAKAGDPGEGQSHRRPSRPSGSGRESSHRSREASAT